MKSYVGMFDEHLMFVCLFVCFLQQFGPNTQQNLITDLTSLLICV